MEIEVIRIILVNQPRFGKGAPWDDFHKSLENSEESLFGTSVQVQRPKSYYCVIFLESDLLTLVDFRWCRRGFGLEVVD